MARLVNNILGPIKGRMGALVASSWKGVPYIKARPRKRGKKRRPGERLNQSRFATAHYWLQPLIEFLRIGFKGYATRLEGFNAAKSYCLKNAFTGIGPEKDLDPALIRVSYGDLPLPTGISVKKSGDYTLQFKWDKAYVKGSNKWDQAMLLAYDSKHRVAEMKLTGRFRDDGADELALPKRNKMSYEIYIAFIAHDRSSQSHSMYMGMITT